MQAVVFGVSCAYDVQDGMEKRVRSRFSNRKIFLEGLGSAKVGGVAQASRCTSMPAACCGTVQSAGTGLCKCRH